MQYRNKTSHPVSDARVLASSFGLAVLFHLCLLIVFQFVAIPALSTGPPLTDQPFRLRPLRYIRTTYPGPDEEVGPKVFHLPSNSPNLDVRGFLNVGESQCDPNRLLLQSSLFAEGIGWRPKDMVLLSHWEEVRIASYSLEMAFRKMPGDLRSAAREAVSDYQSNSTPGPLPPCLVKAIDATVVSEPDLRHIQKTSGGRFVETISSSYPPHCGYFSVSHLGFSADSRLLVLFRHWYGCGQGYAAMEFWTARDNTVYQVYSTFYPTGPVY